MTSHLPSSFIPFENEAKLEFDQHVDHHGMNQDLDIFRDDLELHEQIEDQIYKRAKKRPKLKVRGVKNANNNRVKRAKSSGLFG